MSSKSRKSKLRKSLRDSNRRSFGAPRRLSHESLEARELLALVVSEIMYNHNGGGSLEPTWEWFELYNSGPGTVDVSNYVVDDENSNAHEAANIASGSIPENSVAVFYNADKVSAADFEAVWGSGINIIPVTTWSNMSLGNGGDKISLWDSFGSYTTTPQPGELPEHESHANAILSITYDDGAPWPSDSGDASIYLTDLSADMNEGSNWALSAVGTDGAFPSNVAVGNLGDIGSPGFAPGTEVLPSVLIQQTDGSTTVSESGTIDTYNIGLATVPAGSVEITVTADVQSEVSLDGTNFSNSLVATFNDDTLQTITIRAVDDGDIEAGHNSAISHEITASNDVVDYPTSLSIPDLNATVLDNDLVIDLKFTEIMFNPSSDDNNWEWIELFNAGPVELDISGFVVDDANPNFHAAANIVNGTIPAGGTAILHDSATTDFGDAWSDNINLVPVDNWVNFSLGNDGDQIGIWDSFVSYQGDHVNHANIVAGVEYNSGGDWPSDNGAESIYLRDVYADPTAPANWQLSATGTDGAYASSTTDTNMNDGMDIGSPGLLPGIPIGPSITISSVGPNGNEVGEDGTLDTYTINANTMPATGFEVSIATDNQTEVSLDGRTFSRTLEVTINDTARQTIYVRGFDDSDIETDHHSLIAHAITTSTDLDYPIGTNIADISFDVSDDDYALSDLIFSEIMFAPDSSDGFWEWVEVYNRSSNAIDLSGYVLDDNNATAHTQANIQSGSVPAGGTAILYNSAVTAGEFADAWRTGLNLIPVSGWTNIGLGNGGDQFALWSSFAAYTGDHQIQANAETSQPYDTNDPWPASDNAGSFYLQSINADPHDPGSWALSMSGVAGAFMSEETSETALNTGLDVGSPGSVPTDTTAPKIVSATVNTGIVDPPDKSEPQPTNWATQRSDIRTIQLTFDDDVRLAADMQLVLTNLGINAPVDADVVVPVLSDQIEIVGTVATIHFEFDDLESGVYELQITNTFTDLVGNPLDGDSDDNPGGTYIFTANDTNNFYELTSEFSGDNGVSVFDFSTFSYWFGDAVGVAPSYVDMNRDGGVSVFDFSFFSDNFSIGVIFEDALAASTISTPRVDNAPEQTEAGQLESIDVVVDWARDPKDEPALRMQPTDESEIADLALLEFLDEELVAMN